MPIGKLEAVELRELWKHEQHGFSAWLSQNLEILSEAIGLTLSEPKLEEEAGSFSVDLLVEDENAARVIIENQLEATDHDHLGKLLTYLTNLDAKTAIWITKCPRPEHVRAVAWLNETTPDGISFYLVRVDAYRIGNSEPAPLFTVIVGPSLEGKGFGRQKKELAERQTLRLKFWEGLLTRALEQGVTTHAECTPIESSWLGAGTGRPGFRLFYIIMAHECEVRLRIGTSNYEANVAVADALFEKRKAIEKSFGGELVWRSRKRHSSICYLMGNGGLSANESDWARIQDRMIDAMCRLETAFKPYLAADREAAAGST